MPAPARPPPLPPGKGARQSLVRTAIAAQLEQPSIAPSLALPLRFSTLEQPGIRLLTDMVLLIHSRPDITTGAILEHFADDEQGKALPKLAVAPLVDTTVATPLDDRLLDDAEKRAQSFRDAIARLGIQAMQARAEELQSRFAALSAAEKDELRTLLRQVKGIPAPEP